MSDWWKRASNGSRVLAVIAATFVAFGLVGSGLRLVFGTDPGGPASSAFGTAEDGAAALARLAENEGAQVLRLEVPLDQLDLQASPTEGVTLVVADPQEFAPEEAEEAERFVRAGGRLVTSGSAEPFGALLEELDWSSRGVESATPVVPVRETAGIARVAAGRNGSWDDAGGWVPLLSDGGTVVAVRGRVGDGDVIALADPAILWNDRLTSDDNAAFGLAALGLGPTGTRTTVLFAEAAHGYGAGGGPGRAPSEWKWTALLVLCVTVAFLWSRASRFGPPDLAQRELAPARHRYAESLAVSLARTADRDAGSEPLRMRAKRLISRPTAWGGPGAAVPELDQIPANDDALVRLGRLAAKLERGEALTPGEP